MTEMKDAMTMIDTPGQSPHLSSTAARRRAGRRRSELLFQGLGLLSLSLAALFLFALMFSVVKKSYNGFVQSFIQLEIYLDPAIIEPEDLAQFQASVGRLVLQNLVSYPRCPLCP